MAGGKKSERKLGMGTDLKVAAAAAAVAEETEVNKQAAVGGEPKGKEVVTDKTDSGDSGDSNNSDESGDSNDSGDSDSDYNPHGDEDEYGGAQDDYYDDLEISTPGVVAALVESGEPLPARLFFSGVPSVRQAELILGEVALMGPGPELSNLNRLQQVDSAKIILDRVLTQTIPRLKKHPSSAPGKRFLRVEARRLQECGRRVGCDFRARADALHDEMVAYSHLEGEPKKAPGLKNLRLNINRFMNAPVVF